MRKLGQNCAKGVGTSLNLRFKQLKNKRNCLNVLYVVFSKLSNDVSHYSVIRELENLRFLML